MIIQGFRPFAPIRRPDALFRQTAGLLGLDRRRQGGRLGLQLCPAHRGCFIVGNGPARRHLLVHADRQLASQRNRPIEIDRHGLKSCPGCAYQREKSSHANHTNTPPIHSSGTSMSGPVNATRRNARNQVSALRRHAGWSQGRRRKGRPLTEGPATGGRALRLTPNHTRGFQIGGHEISRRQGSIAALQSSPYE